ncbi:uncharacterized protein DS421_16g543080 [Arachis hypogaea]|nr:uncharacterized protein DS421_16g543080 [Arachis hypogaea]
MQNQLEFGPFEPQKLPGTISFNEVTCILSRVRAICACAPIDFVIHAYAPCTHARRCGFL